ncbi:hypothetical protein FA13DRAFT_1748167 [Coprinellus micaceus]|uniref:Uncharacterized protein n=1 Tax=Coprinellus micaceus TaxID=71717 RepID=A0A4Y7RYR6_COPMI|nr:hypothetical protein FA13DRAFT_1748167 [Coprinellus micaceus]
MPIIPWNISRATHSSIQWYGFSFRRLAEGLYNHFARCPRVHTPTSQAATSLVCLQAAKKEKHKI